MAMDRRTFTKSIASFLTSAAGLSLFHTQLYARQYLTVEQAKTILWGNEKLEPQVVKLTLAQRKAIREGSKIRVRRSKLQAWKSQSGGWFLLDYVIGKHEYIDYAIALEKNGAVRGLEILHYRESYGGDVRHRRWRDQFSGYSHATNLRLNKEVMSITGATLSCRHLVEGVNRINHTWRVALSML
ncbi:MAG: FMN-binding protein [Gammaproteobacteria bacterium]|jgi:hypothetical protein|tara:strand:+ start:1427 stop:1981 length:555 start_codon:yes stop_codon:yes gene_type:complete